MTSEPVAADDPEVEDNEEVEDTPVEKEEE
jgi:hypothetical protein